jgi:hypothetical protein
MGFYSAIMSNDFMLFAKDRKDVIMLSDLNLSHKDEYCMFSLISGMQRSESDMKPEKGLLWMWMGKEGEGFE